MNRRSALKALALAIASPTVILNPQRSRESLMRQFCGENYRYDTEHPFAQGDWTYATDAHRAVRAQLHGVEISGDRPAPPMQDVWRKFWRPSARFRRFKFVSPDELTLTAKYSVCPECCGREISLGREYPTKEQWSEFAAKGLIYDPDENTVSDENCPRCFGRTYTGPSQLQIGGRRFNYAMLKPIWSLGEVQASESREDGALLFVSGEFEGIVMAVME